jgi:hypothetical protein
MTSESKGHQTIDHSILTTTDLFVNCDDFFRALSTLLWRTPCGLMWNYSEPAHTARGSTLELYWRSDDLMTRNHHVTIKIIVLCYFFRTQKGLKGISPCRFCIDQYYLVIM